MKVLRRWVRMEVKLDGMDVDGNEISGNGGMCVICVPIGGPTGL